MSRIEDEIITVGAAVPKIAAVSARENLSVLVTWRNGRDAIIDLAPTVHTFKVYAPLRTDRALFESVHIVNPFVIAWGADDAIDMHSSELERLAGEDMATDDFKAFLVETGMTWDAAAAQLGLSRRMVGYYAKGAPIPRSIALACAYLRLAGSAKSPEGPAAKETS